MNPLAVRQASCPRIPSLAPPADGAQSRLTAAKSRQPAGPEPDPPTTVGLAQRPEAPRFLCCPLSPPGDAAAVLRVSGVALRFCVMVTGRPGPRAPLSVLCCLVDRERLRRTAGGFYRRHGIGLTQAHTEARGHLGNRRQFNREIQSIDPAIIGADCRDSPAQAVHATRCRPYHKSRHR